MIPLLCYVGPLSEMGLFRPKSLSPLFKKFIAFWIWLIDSSLKPLLNLITDMLFLDCQFVLVGKPVCQEGTTDLWQVNRQSLSIILVSSTPVICGIWCHNHIDDILVIQLKFHNINKSVLWLFFHLKCIPCTDIPVQLEKCLA